MLLQNFLTPASTKESTNNSKANSGGITLNLNSTSQNDQNTFTEALQKNISITSNNDIKQIDRENISSEFYAKLPPEVFSTPLGKQLPESSVINLSSNKANVSLTQNEIIERLPPELFTEDVSKQIQRDANGKLLPESMQIVVGDINSRSQLLGNDNSANEVSVQGSNDKNANLNESGQVLDEAISQVEGLVSGTEELSIKQSPNTDEQLVNNSAIEDSEKDILDRIIQSMPPENVNSAADLSEKINDIDIKLEQPNQDQTSKSDLGSEFNNQAESLTGVVAPNTSQSSPNISPELIKSAETKLDQQLNQSKLDGANKTDAEVSRPVIDATKTEAVINQATIDSGANEKTVSQGNNSLENIIAGDKVVSKDSVIGVSESGALQNDKGQTSNSAASAVTSQGNNPNNGQNINPELIANKQQIKTEANTKVTERIINENNIPKFVDKAVPTKAVKTEVKNKDTKPVQKVSDFSLKTDAILTKSNELKPEKITKLGDTFQIPLKAANLINQQATATNISMNQTQATGATTGQSMSADTAMLNNQSTPTSSILAKDNPLTTSVPKPQWNQRFAERISMLALKGTTHAKIRLDPPELGPMSVRIQTVGGETSIQFTVNNPIARDLVDSGSQRLREMLEEHGFNSVDVGVNEFKHRGEDGSESSELDEEDIEFLSRQEQESDSSNKTLASAQDSIGIIDIFA